MTKKPGREIEAALKEKIALEAPRNRRRQRIVARFVVHPNQIMSGRSSCWTTRHELSIPGVGIDAEEARAGDRKAARQGRKLTVGNSFFGAKVQVFGLDPGMSTPDRSDARPRLPGSLDPPAVRVVVARVLGGLPPQRPANDDSVLDAAERRAVHLPGTTLARCPYAHYDKCNNSRLAWCDRRRRTWPAFDPEREEHGLIHAGKRTWTLAYRRWLTTIRFDHAAQQIVLQDYIHAVQRAEERVVRLTCQIEELAPSWSLAPVVQAFQAMRGVAFVVAVTVAAEVGDFARFANPRQLMAYTDWR